MAQLCPGTGHNPTCCTLLTIKREKPMQPENLKTAIQLRHALHRHPELSMQEEWTRAHLQRFLETHTRLEIVDQGRWFYARYRSPASILGPDQTPDQTPPIAFRADFDALPVEDNIDAAYRSETPGVGHKCGHDGHAATLAALALEIDHSGAERDVYFIFQHAEEIGVGARECADTLKAHAHSHKIEEIYAFHVFPGLPTGSVGLKTGLVHFASKGLSMYFEGKQSHASMPEEGINPAFAIARLIEQLENIRDIAARLNLQGTVLCTIVQVVLGEKAFGTSAGSGLLRLTLRAQYEAELERLQQDIEGHARQEAARYGLHYNAEESDVFPETVNPNKSIQKVAAACGQIGIPVRHLPEAFRGSEDFGYYLKYHKGCIFFIGSGEESPGLHTTGFDFPDTLIEPAVEIFKALI